MTCHRQKEVCLFGYNSTDGWWFSWFGATVFAAFVAYQLRKSYLKRRRRASLRQEEGGLSVWIELNGTTASSMVDPTPDWEAQDTANSDGDDGGGGGD
jgi:hypothetical protein